MFFTGFTDGNSRNNGKGFGFEMVNHFEVPAFKIVSFSGPALKLFRMKNSSDFISYHTATDRENFMVFNLRVSFGIKMKVCIIVRF